MCIQDSLGGVLDHMRILFAAQHSVQLTVGTRRAFWHFPGIELFPFRRRVHAPTHRS
jgi:hypothetical protein